jgi:hypothetical protein
VNNDKMKTDNLIKLNEILAESKMFAKDLSLSKGTSLYRKIMKLLVLLVKVQALTTSIRADCMEEILSINPNFPNDIILGENLSQGKTIVFDRRRSRIERRKLPTYIAVDRRSGIAERRKRNKKVA